MPPEWRINKFLWIVLVFAAAYFPLASVRGQLTVPLWQVYAVFALGVANGGLRTWSGWRQGGFNSPIFGWVFSVFDASLIAVGIRYSGGLDSELWLLYFVLIVSETLYARPRDLVFMLGLVSVALLVATWPAQQEGGFWLTVGSRLFFLYVVASFARELTTLHEERARQIARLQEELAASEERARIAREIHDGLGHALVASILRLDLCRKLLPSKPAEALAILEEEVPHLRQAWGDGRDLAFHLKPWPVGEGGFLEGLRAQIGRFAERTNIAVRANLPDEDPPAGAMQTAKLTRILQESLTNVARHSDATEVEISLVLDQSCLIATVRDNGKGCDPHTAFRGFGLSAMRERAEELGGSLEVQTAPGQGFSVMVRMPLGRLR